MSRKKLPMMECDDTTYLLPIGMAKYSLDKLTSIIVQKIITELQEYYKDSNLPYHKIADQCQTTEKHICNLINGKFGDKFTLDMAIKIWKGLGNPPETLIADCNVEPLLAATIKRIKKSDYRELFELMVEVLKDYEYADPVQLAVVRGALETVKATILDRKSQPAGEPGENLSNSAGK